MKLLDAAVSEAKIKKIVEKEVAKIGPVGTLPITQKELEGIEQKQKDITTKEKLAAEMKKQLKAVELEIIKRIHQGAKIEDGRIKAKHEVKEEVIGRTDWKALAMAHAPQDEIDAAQKKAQSKKRRNIQLELFT